MQINLTGHHVDITDSLRNYVNEKMGRLERHFDKVSNTHVILSLEKLMLFDPICPPRGPWKKTGTERGWVAFWAILQAPTKSALMAAPLITCSG